MESSFESALNAGLAAAEASPAPEIAPISTPQAESNVHTTQEVTRTQSTDPWDNLPQVTEDKPVTQESNPEDKTPDPTEPTEPKAKTPWKQLRETESNYKKMLPEYEALKREVQELRSKQAEIPQEVQKELQDLRDYQAAYSIKQTAEWRTTVDEPLTAQYERLAVVAKDMGVNYDDLALATNENNSYARNKAIKKLLEDSTTGFEQSAYTEAIEAAAEANGIYKKAADLTAKSHEIKNAYEGKKTFEETQREQQQQQRLSDSSKAMLDRFTNSLKSTDILSDEKFRGEIQSVRPANIQSEPEMAIYQAQAGKLLPSVITRLHAVTKELAQVKGVLEARSKASAPAVNGATPGTENKPTDFYESLLQGAQSQGLRTR